jgi:uncharacterized protein YjiK
MDNKNTIQWLFFGCAALTVLSCRGQQKKYTGPPGYSFHNPKRYAMPGELNEISGIALNQGSDDTLYAEQDEEGKLFHFKLGDAHIQTTRFAKKGDFEDISICHNQVIMLRSDGVLFTFPLAETSQLQAANVKVFKNLLPPGEYEGLASDDSQGRIWVLCKHCRAGKTSKRGGGFLFQLNRAGDLEPAGDFEINVREIEEMTGTPKINFHPSALALNPFTREWYVLSSVNHLLVVTGEDWKVKAVYPLDPSLFPQPEGIAIDRQQNLYISNERKLSPAATVLVFAHQNK